MLESVKAAYIHIPFCNTICSYCDFTKIYYKEDLVDKYLDLLNNEIKQNYKGEILSTIYIGGGTPSSLSTKQLTKLFEILKQFKLDNNCEFTFECNPENLTKEKVEILQKNGINRVSLGVQSFNNNILNYLNRNHTKEQVVNTINYLKQAGLENISIDLIYGIKNQNINNLKEDIKEILKLNINHISTYSLIVEPNTILSINKEENIDEDIEYEMYKYINDTLTTENYIQYEISNYGKENYQSKHNLTYWNNKEYYGFGLGASGYINNKRHTNTKNINEYLDNNYLKESINLTKNEQIENHLILGLRKIKGINIEEMNRLYNIDILHNKIIKKLIKERKLIANENLYIEQKHLYIMNEILVKLIGEKYE